MIFHNLQKIDCGDTFQRTGISRAATFELKACRVTSPDPEVLTAIYDAAFYARLESLAADE